MGERGTILVVDDQVGVRFLVAEALRDEKYLVETAASGLEALDIMERVEPDLILLDMKMPGMSGLDVLQEMKSRDLNYTVIMMTALSDQEKIVQAQRMGVSYFLPKPFDMEELHRLVNHVMSFRIKAEAPA